MRKHVRRKSKGKSVKIYIKKIKKLLDVQGIAFSKKDSKTFKNLNKLIFKEKSNDIFIKKMLKRIIKILKKEKIKISSNDNNIIEIVMNLDDSPRNWNIVQKSTDRLISLVYEAAKAQEK